MAIVSPEANSYESEYDDEYDEESEEGSGADNLHSQRKQQQQPNQQ